MAEKIVQTAGRNQLGEFAPMFAFVEKYSFEEITGAFS